MCHISHNLFICDADTIYATISLVVVRISVLRTWVINHKNNDSKTEFLIVRSQFSNVAMPNLTVTVGDTEISSSVKPGT